jgi:hypothetical protein
MDGITNRMLQGGGDSLHRALFYLMETIWLSETYPEDWTRVLHPLIPEDDYTQILRGLPEGSRLSPTLFGILISELLQEIKHKHPDSDTIGPRGTMWVGALAFVRR